MLVLQRGVDEEVVIGDGPDRVVVMVLSIRGDVVRLGFSASPNVVIDRREVADAKERERRK